MKKLLIVLALIMVTAFAMTSCDELKAFFGDDEHGSTDGSSSVKWAGIRVSSYGMDDSFEEGYFPSVNEMMGFGNSMESKYSGSTGSFIWIVGTVSEKDWTCTLEFPLSKEISKVRGIKYDKAENYLSACDKAGYSVWLQVEPGNADLVALATEVMSHYKNHKCVKGFGIDVEWYKPAGTNGEGTRLSSEVANNVLKAVRDIDPSYTVFVKHWDEEWLPEAKDGFIYVNDSQGFKAYDGMTALESMRDEFSSWAETFAPCPVMFQIGYNADRSIWRTFKDPAKELGKYLAEGCTSGNDIGIIWVDFTLNSVL